MRFRQLVIAGLLLLAPAVAGAQNVDVVSTPYYAAYVGTNGNMTYYMQDGTTIVESGPQGWGSSTLNTPGKITSGIAGTSVTNNVITTSGTGTWSTAPVQSTNTLSSTATVAGGVVANVSGTTLSCCAQTDTSCGGGGGCYTAYYISYPDATPAKPAKPQPKAKGSVVMEVIGFFALVAIVLGGGATLIFSIVSAHEKADDVASDLRQHKAMLESEAEEEYENNPSDEDIEQVLTAMGSKDKDKARALLIDIRRGF